MEAPDIGRIRPICNEAPYHRKRSQMRIFTSCWFTPLPDTIQKIGVSRGTPRGYAAGYRKMPELAPGSWFNSASIRDYKQLYFENLSRLDPAKIMAKMEDLSAGKDCALLCYEKPTDKHYCHRAYISVWLQESLGLEVLEYGLEDEGCGWRHPKLPEQYRLPAKQPDPLHVGPYVGAEAIDGSGVKWTVVGFDPDNIDQAMIEDGEKRKRSISGDVLKQKFQPVL